MSVLQDLRYGARLMLRRPGFAAISVLTLSVGIGLTAMMFSIVNGAILKGLPFDEPDRLMAVVRTDLSQGFDNMSTPLHDFEAWREEQRGFEGLAAYSTGTFNVSGPDGAERYAGAWITANGFDLLRARPILGRTFTEGEDAPGAEPVAVLGYRVWQDRYGGAPDVLGRTIRINGEEATIIGVMEERFMFPVSQVIWLPERRTAIDHLRGAPGVPWVSVFGRLNPDVSRDRANVQMSGIAGRLAESHPETNENIGADVKPFTEQFIGKEPRRLLYVMLGGVFGVLLIACANVANLLLSQAALRSKEVGIRTALGATRVRVILQFLTEPLLLAAVGAVLGLGIAWLGIRLFDNAVAATEPPFWLDFGIDGTVLLFVLGLALLATLLSGVLPAIRASGGNVHEVLKEESRGASSFRGSRLTRGLVVAEIALSVVLLAGAGLMIRSVTNLRSVDFAFHTEEVFTARVGLPEADRTYVEVADRIRFFEDVEARLAAEPEVRAVAMTTALPGLWASSTRFEVEGRTYDRPADRPLARSAVITPSFFEAFGVALVQGRAFGSEDREGSVPVAIVNQSLARRHFPDGDAVGSRIRPGEPDSDRPWLTIVGVAPDLHMSGAQNEEPEGFYTPLAQDAGVRFMSIAARTAGPPTQLTPRVRGAVSAVDPDIPIYWVRTLAEGIAGDLWFFRVFGTIFMVMGFVALFLAAIGLYGVMAFSVSRRTREMGVRMALGAQRDDVVHLVMRQGFAQLAIGLAVGLAAAWGVSVLLTGFLFGVSPRDPTTFVSIVAVLVLAGTIASWVPALRATRVDPVVALRYD
jgi:putative ABC transport system permease protein